MPIITASAALLGSAIGGLITFVTAFTLKRIEWKQDLAKEEIKKREELYSDFLTHCTGLSLKRSGPEGYIHINDVNKLTENVGKIRLLSSEPVVKAAQKLAEIALDESLADKGKKLNSPLAEFTQFCRLELTQLKKS
ncbi:hypothetical protein ACWPKS_08770 [Coraliomargarita sp. W4R72]